MLTSYRMIRQGTLDMKALQSLKAKVCVSLRGYTLNLHRSMILLLKYLQIQGLVLDANGMFSAENFACMTFSTCL